MRAIVAVADLVVSWTLVALTVTEVAVVDVVKRPADVTLPPEADQVTAEL